jgi:hypothetical protein
VEPHEDHGDGRPPRSKRERAGVAVGVVLGVVTGGTLGIAFGFVFWSLIVAPWVMLLWTGPSEPGGDIFDFYWTVSPEPWWLAVRAGICVAGVLVLVFNPRNWIGKTRDVLKGEYRTPDPADAHLTEATPTETEPSLQLGAVEQLAQAVALFIALLTVTVGVFAGTDYQAAHDHPDPPSCFVNGNQAVIPTGHLSSSDAFYFAVGNLSTAGTGSLAPVSSTCRALVTWQTLMGALLILFGIGGFLIRVSQHRSFLGTGDREPGSKGQAP